jgi:hypothetical protein
MLQAEVMIVISALIIAGCGMMMNYARKKAAV